MSLRTLLLSTVLILSNTILAQHTSQLYNWGVSGKVHGGFVMMHRQGVEHLVEGHTIATQLDFFKTPTGKKDWHHASLFPDVGFTLLHVNTGSKSLGNVFAIMPSVSFFRTRKKLITISASGGMGLGYFTKHWSRVNERKNVMIGSALNLAVTLQSEIRYQISEELSASAGVAFTHFSNAGTVKPNLGINIPSISLGLRYANLTSGEKVEPSVNTLTTRHSDFLVLLAGFSNQFDVLSENTLALTSSIEYGKFTASKRNRFHAALDIFYNKELEEYYLNEDISFQKSDLIQVGVSGGYSRFLGRISMYLGMGAYLIAHDLPSLRIYNRVGLRYAPTERLIINTTVKTHLLVADYFELGLAYCVWKK